MPHYILTNDQRVGWRHARIPINDLGDEVLLHLVVCRRCVNWFAAKSSRERGACSKHLKRTGRAARCSDFFADAPTTVEMVMETGVYDGVIVAIETPAGRKYGLPEWVNK